MGNAHGQVHWNELNTREPDKAAAFYEKVLGWTVEVVDTEGDEPYRIIRRGVEVVGGIFTMSGPDFEQMRAHWFTLFAVDDADRAAAETVAAGGRVLRGPFDVPGTGRLVVVEEPGGARCGLIQSAQKD